MKHIFFTLVAALLFAACSNSMQENTFANTQDSNLAVQDSVSDTAVDEMNQAEEFDYNAIWIRESKLRDSLWNKVSHKAYFNHIDTILQKTYEGSPYTMFNGLELKMLHLDCPIDELVYAYFVDYFRLADYNFLIYKYGKECETKFGFSVVDNDCKIIDQLSHQANGCFPNLTWDEADIDTIGKYVYFESDLLYNAELEVSDDNSISIINTTETEFLIKDTTDQTEYFSQFNDTTIYRLDSTYHFQISFENNDNFNADEMLKRMKVYGDN